jgi:UDP-GlcNAc3NAcA epimerase
VLVYGDTDSTLAGAIAAAKLHIRIAHVEAGLRSFNRRMPEEINRVLTDHASDLLFTPTQAASRNLAREGVATGKIAQVGDVMYDAALYYSGRSSRESTILADLSIGDRDFILFTMHRAEAVDTTRTLDAVLSALACSQLPVIWPVHPRTLRRIGEGGLALPETVTAIDPVGYLDMIALERGASLIVTDSGGVQKEAYFCGVPCLVLRHETEWTELVESGAAKLVGSDSRLLAEALSAGPWPLSRDTGLYGDGHAGARIVDAMRTF